MRLADDLGNHVTVEGVISELVVEGTLLDGGYVFARTLPLVNYDPLLIERYVTHFLCWLTQQTSELLIRQCGGLFFHGNKIPKHLAIDACREVLNRLSADDRRFIARSLFDCEWEFENQFDAISGDLVPGSRYFEFLTALKKNTLADLPLNTEEFIPVNPTELCQATVKELAILEYDDWLKERLRGITERLPSYGFFANGGVVIDSFPEWARRKLEAPAGVLHPTILFQPTIDYGVIRDAVHEGLANLNYAPLQDVVHQGMTGFVEQKQIEIRRTRPLQDKEKPGRAAKNELIPAYLKWFGTPEAAKVNHAPGEFMRLDGYKILDNHKVSYKIGTLYKEFGIARKAHGLTAASGQIRNKHKASERK